MKKTSKPKKASAETSAAKPSKGGTEDMRPEYRFDYRNAKPNRFAAKFSAPSVAVVLDPDVAAVFKSSESVNQLLRSVIGAMPESKRKGRA